MKYSPFSYPCVLTLAPVPWAQDHALARVMSALTPDPSVISVLITGGAVRDAFVGHPGSGDIDLATIFPPDEVIHYASIAGLRGIPTGIDHGTVTIIADGRGVEVTTLRHDVSTDGRHADVSFTQDWGGDAARRDFTMNALYADLDGHVFDPCGLGLADARAGLVRFVGDPAARIAEDYLRILRFFRFYAWYGKGEIDPNAVHACADARAGLLALSSERITKEVIKLLAAPDPLPALKKMFEARVLDFLFKGLPDFDFLSCVVSSLNILGLSDPSLLLFVLSAKDVINIKKNFRLSNKDIKFLEAISVLKKENNNDLSSLLRDAARYGVYETVAATILFIAEQGRQITSVDVEKYRHVLAFSCPPFPVTGHDLHAAGMDDGPKMGACLSAMRAAWIASDFTLDRDALLALDLAGRV